MSIALPPSSVPSPFTTQGVEEHIDWEEDFNEDELSLGDLSEEELIECIRAHLSGEAGTSRNFTVGLYIFFISTLLLGANERESAAMVLMREVQATNITLDEYNQALALLQAQVNKDGGDIDLHSITLPSGETVHQWLKTNEPDIYTNIDTFVSQDELNALVNSMQSKIETIGTNTQILMLQIQDEIGKGDTLSQGAKSVLEGMERVLRTVIGGL